MLKENYLNIVDIIKHACFNASRPETSVRLIAVSKTKPIDKIEEAIKLGINDFGENKAQELKSKVPKTSSKVNWHFIGHLQSNKVKDVVPIAEYIHAVDSLKLVREIDKRAKNINKIQKILIEINTSMESSKFGLTNEDDVFEIASACNETSNVKLVGLMTMAPFTNEDEILRNCFIKLRNLKQKLNNNGFNLSELSMGISNDFKIAIEEGATMVRIGTALFGARNYQC